MARTLQELAQEAIEVQNACNLSGVTRSFALAMGDLWVCARELEKGTQWVNEHAITRAWVSKLVSLSHYDMGDNTFEILDLLAKGEPLPKFCAQCGKPLEVLLTTTPGESPYRCRNALCVCYTVRENFFGEEVVTSEDGEGA